MRYFYLALIVIGIVLLVLTVYCLVQCRRRWAVRKVLALSNLEKQRKLDKALSAFGFCYDEENDAICSGMYPWQREMGYCSAYDEGAAAMYMVFDCEPIYFDYGDSRYLIELWKGQYGCTTGAEIGFYVNHENNRRKKPQDLFYECVSDEERLPMRFVLYRNGEAILQRSGLHWWLTGFQVGMYTEPDALSLDVGIAFPNAGMCNAFYEGLLRAGYTRSDIYVEQCRVYFRFDVPRGEQPDICGGRCRKRIQRKNHKKCKIYCKVTGAFDTTLDRISYIGYCFPLLYRMVIRIGTTGNRRKFKKHHRRMMKHG